ncbi:hypothetical protein FACS1894217_09630 [Clostridia bacterium]|nr:hypothetical protein FACS1894217_09630 [Clostridia bacterium]
MLSFVKKIIAEDIFGLTARTAFFLLFATLPTDDMPLPLALWGMSRVAWLLMGGVYRAFTSGRLKSTLRLQFATFVFAACALFGRTLGLGAILFNFLCLVALYALTPGCRVCRRWAFVSAGAVTALLTGATAAQGYATRFIDASLTTAVWAYYTCFCVILGAELAAYFANRTKRL